MRSRSAFWCLALWSSTAALFAADRDLRPVELMGTASGFKFYRTWNTYYRGEDFTFRLTDETGQTWRVISREITPAYEWRMGPTYPEVSVDWKKAPQVKVVGVRGVDRIPETFHDLDLKRDDRIVTAFVVSVPAKPDQWQEYYVNNWFHRWGAETDGLMRALYADRPPPYDIYGFVGDAPAPWDAKSRDILKDLAPDKLMYHGRIRRTKDNPSGYEVELLQLIGRNSDTGGAQVLFGDAEPLPKLDGRKPE